MTVQQQKIWLEKHSDLETIRMVQFDQLKQSFLIPDIQAPVFPNGCPDIKIPAERLGKTNYATYKLPDVTDNSGETVIVRAEPPSGSEFDLGITNVTVTALDASGHEATCQFLVAIESK